VSGSAIKTRFDDWAEAARMLAAGKQITRARTLLVVLGDQLDRDAATLDEIDPDEDVILMMEVAEEATHVASHKKRTALFFSAMRHYALELIQRGFRVRYVRLDDDDNEQSFDAEVARAVRDLSPQRILITHPGEHRVMKMVASWETEHGIDVDIRDDAHYYSTPDEFAEWKKGRKQIILEWFYREMRKKHRVLVDDDDKPTGGEWNFDKQNREVFKKTPTPPKPYTPRTDAVTEAVLDMVEQRFADAPGALRPFHWPVTRDEAKRALAKFIEDRLPRFGTYQDAMWTGQPWLYHSVISSSVNLKMLNPRECVDATLRAYEQGRAPINSVEGFVRQLLGWREFIRGVYWTEGPGYTKRNSIGQRGSLPDFYWNADTDMRCMAECVGEVVENGFGHHIQRLMITGNFALIAGVHPRAISDWYLGMYVDAVDWVTLPNTLGMAMHADGGVVGTKPYAASGKYVSRMSNYCEHCRYDPSKRTGDDACPFTTFYWDFLIRNRERYRDNNRMAMILKNVDRMNEQQRVEITVHAKKLRKQWGISPI
jgi:deoxyribodipyrimidine photolyase-related protein